MALLKSLLSSWGGGRRNHFYQLNAENKGRIRRNDDFARCRVFYVFSTVAESRGYGEQAFPALFHTPYTYLEARDEFWRAEYEGKRLIAVRCGAIEDGAVGESAFIEDGNGISRLGFQARTDFHVLTLDSSGLFGVRCGRLILRRRRAGSYGCIDKVTSDGKYNDDCERYKR